MAKRTLESLAETETIIRFDETDEPASLWTSSARVRKLWEDYGFKLRVDGAGWRGEVPKDRISYKVMKP